MNCIGTTKDLQSEDSQTSRSDVCAGRVGFSMAHDSWVETPAVVKDLPC